VLALLSGPRAGTAAALKERFTHAGVALERIEGDVVAACQAVSGMATRGDRILVFGSFLTVGPARDWHAATVGR
jgi:dihydrofolate synthase/folylpolyglutamate synthase